MFRYSSSGDGFYLKKDSIRHNIYARHKLPNFGISSLPRRNTRCEIPTGFTLPCSFSYPPGRPATSFGQESFGRERYILAGNLSTRFCKYGDIPTRMSLRVNKVSEAIPSMRLLRLTPRKDRYRFGIEYVTVSMK
jgi:hypothetical protein